MRSATFMTKGDSLLMTNRALFICMLPHIPTSPNTSTRRISRRKLRQDGRWEAHSKKGRKSSTLIPSKIKSKTLWRSKLSRTSKSSQLLSPCSLMVGRTHSNSKSKMGLEITLSLWIRPLPASNRVDKKSPSYLWKQAVSEYRSRTFFFLRVP